VSVVVATKAAVPSGVQKEVQKRKKRSSQSVFGGTRTSQEDQRSRGQFVLGNDKERNLILTVE
jgi:hypothetical protein